MAKELSQRLPNPVAEFVLGEVPAWERLNAPDTQRGNEVFTSVLGQALRTQTVSDVPLDSGCIYHVHALTGHKDLVVKRQITGWHPSDTEKADAERDMADFTKQHAMFLQFFGTEFIPHTEFAIVEGTNFGDSSHSYILGTEYVAVQERVDGMLLQGEVTVAFAQAAATISPAMRETVDRFVERYREMQQTGYVLDDQVIFDFESERVWLVDTNAPITFQALVDDTFFLEDVYGEDFSPTTSAQLFDGLLDHYPGFADMRGKSWEEIRGRFADEVERHSINESVFLALDYFPPDGGDNRFVRQLRALGLASPLVSKASEGIDEPEVDEEEPVIKGSWTIAELEEDRVAIDGPPPPQRRRSK